MDRKRALDTFTAYVADYDASNPRIMLKVQHTLRVTSLCERIARGLGMTPEDVGLAWLLGLLHDIGRFEQVRRYDTFNDAVSVGHAALGVQVLFDQLEPDGQPFIRSFLPDPGSDELIRTAIATHSDFRLPAELDERTRTFCQILRDADKIDILKVNCVCPIEDIYGVTDADMRASQLSPTCVEVFYQHSCLPRGIRNFPADIMLSHICFAWEIVFPQSLQIMREQGYLTQMLSRTWDLPPTQKAFDAMAQHMNQQLEL